MINILWLDWLQSKLDQQLTYGVIAKILYNYGCELI
jgi:hypothetical protein